jgi:hypothetical protein
VPDARCPVIHAEPASAPATRRSSGHIEGLPTWWAAVQCRLRCALTAITGGARHMIAVPRHNAVDEEIW